MAATILLLRDYHVLERYRYVIATVGILLLMAPRLPGIGSQVNGAYLGIDLGPLSFQPAEVAKICVVIFLASYLREKRELLAITARRIAGLTIPPLKHFGPLLVVWGAAMLMLVFIRDLGSSLMFFGAFLALLYIATARFSYVVAGLALFLVGARVMESAVPHVGERIDIWLDPWARDAPAGAGQIQQSLFAQADGGLFGMGLGESLLKLPGPFAPDCAQPFPDCGSILPAPHTDEIYALIVSELGLFGAAALVLAYALIAARGLKTAVMAARRVLEAPRRGPDGRVRAAGGGDHRRRGPTDPADRGDAAVRQLRGQLGDRQHDPARAVADDLQRRPAPARRTRGSPPRLGAAAGVNSPIVRLYGLMLLLFAALVGFTSYWAVFDADNLKDNTENRRPLIAEQTVKRGTIKTADGVTVAESFPVGGGKNPVYVREYPQGSAVRAPGRLQLHRRRPHGDRAVGERVPGRGAKRVRRRSSTRSATSRRRATTSP